MLYFDPCFKQLASLLFHNDYKIKGQHLAFQIDILDVNRPFYIEITESGKVNRINLIQGLPNTGKGKSGSNLIKLASGDKIVSVVSGNENDLIHVKCVTEDSLIRICDLNVGSSISTGDKVLTTRGNKIIRCYIEQM